jgi:hypothetical protein
MATIQDIIMQQVSKAAGNVSIPSGIQNQVLGGLSESILGSLTQTATKAGGIDSIKELLTGKASAAASPITALAGKIFAANTLKNLNLDSALTSKLTGLIPLVLGNASSFIKDKDGDGDVDLNDILLTLKGSGAGAGIGSSIVKGVLGSLLGGKK